MGIMHRIRTLSPVIITTVMVLFLILMVKPDNFEETINTIKRGGANASVGSVNGEEISRTELDSRVADIVEQQRTQAKQQGREDVEIDEASIRQQVWDQMVQEKLLAQEAERSGLTVSIEEVADLLFENPPEYLKNAFKDSSGTFMRSIYEKLLRNPDSYGDYVRNDADKEEAIREWKRQIKKLTDGETKQKLMNNVQSLLGSGAVISPSHVRRQFEIENTSMDVNLVFLDYSTVADRDVNVTDEEISGYYETHKQFFKQKPARKIKYVNFPLIPSKEDSLLVQKRATFFSGLLAAPGANKDSVFEYYLNEYNGKTNDFKAANEVDPQVMALLAGAAQREVIGPVVVGGKAAFLRLDARELGGDTTVRASHILVGFGTNKDSAKAVANKLYASAKKGDFTKLASENSIDKQSAMRGGDLDYFGRGRMVPEFEKAAFAASVGSIVGPVESQFGYHIIKVTDKRFEKIKYSEIPMAPSISSATRKNLMREAMALKEQVEGGANIDTIARQNKRMAIETALFEKSSQILGSYEVTDFAFANDVGVVSKPFDMKGSSYSIIQVTDKREAGVKPLADVKDEIKNKLVRRKKIDALKKKAEDIAQKLASYGALEAVKTIDSTLSVRTSTGVKDDGNVSAIGRDNVLTASLMKLQPGKISGAIRGEKGYYIAQVLAVRKEPKELAKESKEIEARMRQQLKQNAYYQWYGTVKDKAEIEDNRSKIYGRGL
ncbi:MAG: peptidylprolyl isomerase [Candidatus Kapaibacterium sp.]|jgi:peptidyl-prolyl cis-trans isomerase D